MLRVTLAEPVWMLGMLEEAWNSGFESTTYSSDPNSSTGTVGLGRGLRGVWRGSLPGGDSRTSDDVASGARNLIAKLRHRAATTGGGDASTVTSGLSLARWRYAPTDDTNTASDYTTRVNTRLPVSLSAVTRRTCVPLTTRKPVDETTFNELATNFEIYRRDPIDCIIAGDAIANFDVNNGLFGNGGVCHGSQQLNWPSGVSASAPSEDDAINIDNDAGFVSNLR